MGGIVFFRTEKLEEIEEFYQEQIGMHVWLEQAGCTILSHDNLLLGFCQREGPETEGMITFYYDTKAEVDEIYEKLKDIAETKPKENRKYRIYQWFAKDPEGRNLEFQAFLHDLPEINC
ncbi:MAG: VOC family protein [Candidatus Thorarchaeota archaeon]|nr:VOC family protein [Candidatus Thorarchaeota archaeon]